MEEHRPLTVHHLIRAVILAGFAFYVVHLVKIDKLQYYIAPRMMPYIKYSAVAMFLLATYYLYLALQGSDHKHHGAACDCGHEPARSLPKHIFIYGLFLLPLLLGFAFPDKIMGSDAASVKGMKLTVKNVVQQPSGPLPTQVEEAVTDVPQSVLEESKTELPASEASPSSELDALFPYDEFSREYADLGKILYGQDVITMREEAFLEYISTIDLYRDNFVGKTIEISGFVYREDDMAPNQFAVSRMAMSCCTADAEPYGLMAEWSQAADFNKDTWITLRGKLEIKKYRDADIIVLNADKVTKIEAPKDPYVYPYFGNITELEKQ
ncbi:putative repeat protein (TIGR03943 family) [Paenibacillus cellulosilyticus]|uniref:Putative repeat protein (TIGR03943 family) n=1 Tax=Paenibacillus cellulosilyticus TaxID=375489 RepID=A0A2V2YQQ9_9BACL|nr:TIGR03943 family protein [Paenibacillus cellulosilyticus]PWV99346.1 putative repeat protein (TIGR03943 family) [Paenibacillus cellulosilyticus]QKS45109.1 TIGR03943 family protein [Paenibacillus cellulosilyticus]